MRLGAATAILLGFIVACGASGHEITLLDEEPTDCGRADVYTEPDSVLIANEIMYEWAASLLINGTERDALADQVDNSLELVRGEFPPAAEIHPPPSGRWLIGLEFQGQFLERLLEFEKPGSAHFVLRWTGDKSLDDLNEKLGLLAMDVRLFRLEDGSQGSAFASVCISRLANPGPVIAEYEEIPAIKSASRRGFVGDSPAIDMRQDDGDWYIVVREAGGDCPAGCGEETLNFFRVSGTSIRRIAESEAASDPLFVRVVDLARWANDWPWPSPTPTPVP